MGHRTGQAVACLTNAQPFCYASIASLCSLHTCFPPGCLSSDLGHACILPHEPRSGVGVTPAREERVGACEHDSWEGLTLSNP